LLDGLRPWDERTYDVGFVGAQIRKEGGTYGRRQSLVAEIEKDLPTGRRCMESAVDAQRLAEIYEQSRTVFNEGGFKHYPITMRVFEAIGAGALLITDDIPGTDCLFEPEKHYTILSEPIVDQIGSIVGDPRSAAAARVAREFAEGRHHYDHRVDELVAIATDIDTVASGSFPDEREMSAVGSVIDSDAQVRSVAAFGLPGLVDELPWREVWLEGDRDGGRGPRFFDAVAIGSSWDGDPSTLVGFARRFVYVEGAHRDSVVAVARELHDEILVEEHGDTVRIDLLAEGYRVFPDGHRLVR
jgi:hypothetical protein